MSKTCRTCKHQSECMNDEEIKKRQKVWSGSPDEWTCGMYDEAAAIQIRWEI